MFVILVNNLIKHYEGFVVLFCFLRKNAEIATFDEMSNSNGVMVPGGTFNKLETQQHFINAVSLLDWRVSTISEWKRETPEKPL